jgi:hypothetical protein
MAAVRKTVLQVIEETVIAVETAICGLCWPNGWPHGAQQAQCEHGDFNRPDPAGDPTPATPVPDQTKTPTPDTTVPGPDPVTVPPAAPVQDPAPPAEQPPAAPAAS